MLLKQANENLNIKYIEETKIKGITSEILQKASSEGLYEYKETPVDLIAELSYGLRLYFEDIEKEFGLGTLGILDFSTHTIFLNERLFGKIDCNLGLLNFTIAHEIGHFILHKDIYESSSEKIALLHKKQIQNYEHTVKKMECQANLFAANLLMPESLFREEWNKSKGINYWERRKTLCNFFKVSNSSLGFRLHNLKLI